VVNEYGCSPGYIGLLPTRQAAVWPLLADLARRKIVARVAMDAVG
jgi:hypothetical protein